MFSWREYTFRICIWPCVKYSTTGRRPFFNDGLCHGICSRIVAEAWSVHIQHRFAGKVAGKAPAEDHNHLQRCFIVFSITTNNSPTTNCTTSSYITSSTPHPKAPLVTILRLSQQHRFTTKLPVDIYGFHWFKYYHLPTRTVIPAGHGIACHLHDISRRRSLTPQSIPRW